MVIRPLRASSRQVRPSPAARAIHITVCRSRSPPGLSFGTAQFGVIQALARTVGVAEVRPVDLQDPSEIERGIIEFAREPNGGLIITPNGLAILHRELIINLAAKYKLPAIYPFRYFPRSGGLVSYGIDQMEQARGGASYIDRVLRGANPGELPVQLPTRYELAINLKTAKALGLKIPESFLLRADEVIE